MVDPDVAEVIGWLWAEVPLAKEAVVRRTLEDAGLIEILWSALAPQEGEGEHDHPD